MAAGFVVTLVFGSRDRLGGTENRHTNSALQRLLSRASVLELSVAFADPFYDIDLAVDLIRLAAELRQAPARAPRTATWLKEWGHAVAQLRTGTGEL